MCHMQVTIALLKNAMIKSSSDCFLIDGFPRTLDQAEIFERDIMPCQMVRLIASLTSLQAPVPSAKLATIIWLQPSCYKPAV